MHGILKYITLGAIMIICQILLSEYVNIWPILYIAIFPQFIILLPPTMNRFLHLFIAFVLGLSIDILCDGVMGLNAGALVAMAYIRPAVLKLTIPKASFETYDNAPLVPRTLDLQKLALIYALMLTVFFAIYILLDSAASFTFGYTILKMAVCIIANCIIAVLCNIALLDKILR